VITVVWTTAAACAASPGGGEGGAGEEARGTLRPEVREALRADVLFPSGRRFAAEIADTPARMARGYMFRSEIGPEEGMVFIFPTPGVRSFWMKNTLAPLDMIWMNERFEVVHIERSAPPCKADPCPTYGPRSRASFVLEVAGGTVGSAGLKVGDRVEITFPESR
jgi:uncharacterized membrane protein (UPF0127 family)